MSVPISRFRKADADRKKPARLLKDSVRHSSRQRLEFLPFPHFPADSTLRLFAFSSAASSAKQPNHFRCDFKPHRREKLASRRGPPLHPQKRRPCPKPRPTVAVTVHASWSGAGAMPCIVRKARKRYAVKGRGPRLTEVNNRGETATSPEQRSAVRACGGVWMEQPLRPNGRMCASDRRRRYPMVQLLAGSGQQSTA